jgi:hypothetical protein
MLLVPVEPARQRDEEEMEWVECTGHATSLS